MKKNHMNISFHSLLLNTLLMYLWPHQVVWQTLVHSHFHIPPDMFNRIQVWALAGSLRLSKSCPEIIPLIL